MRLRFTTRAADELEDLIHYIRQRSPQGARKVSARLRQMAEYLLDHPFIGLPTSTGLRRLQAHPYPYLIFYDVTEDEIIVVGIRHSSRDPSSRPGEG